MVNIFKLAEARWKNDKVLGLVEKHFRPLTERLVDAVTRACSEYEAQINDPNYQEMRDVLERQRLAAEELIASGHLQDPEWIMNNIHVLTDNEITKNEVYDWLNSYVKTPQGQANLAYALVNEAGGADDQMEIQFGTRDELKGAGGWASWNESHIQLGKESWEEYKDWNRNQTLPHEIRHVGQQDIPNLSQREYFLYHAGIIEADARLTEYCDGVTEGRNSEAEGYDESLKKVFEREILPYRDRFLAHTSFKTWDEFVKIKESDPETYNRVMGRIKEVQFKAVLNKLMTTELYQRQGSYCKWVKNEGNLPGLRAWCEEMCKRQGMRFERIWPTVEAYAKGEREIPGMERCFAADGRINARGEGKCEIADMLLDHWSVVDADGNGNITIEKDGNRREYRNYAIVRAHESNGMETEYTYDEQGCRMGEVCRLADGSCDEYTYDEKGNRTSSIYRDGDGTLIRSVEYTYDAQGHLRGEIYRRADGSGEEYVYNEKGKRTREVYKDTNGRLIESAEYTYDEQGRRIRKKSVKEDGSSREIVFNDRESPLHAVHKDADGKVIDSDEYTYDEQGREIETVHKDGDGKVVRSSVCAYDAEGHLVNDKRIDEDGGREYVYNQNGRLTKLIYTDTNGSLTNSSEYTYDENGKQIREISKDADGMVVRTAECIYDEHGCRVGEIYKQADGSTSEYTYDERGNRIKAVYKEADGQVTNTAETIYDGKGHVVRNVEKYGDGQLIRMEEFYYNNAGKITGHKSTDDAGNTRETVFNDQECPLRAVHKNADGKVIDSNEYTYDAKGNMASRVFKDGNGKVVRSEEYTCDANGKKIATVCKDIEGNVVSSAEYIHDGQGYLIGEVRRDAEGKVTGGYGSAYEEAKKAQEQSQKEKSGDQANDKRAVRRVRQIDNKEGMDEDLKALANNGKGWKSEEKMAKAPRKRRADKTADKRYYGNRPGGVDDAIAKADTQERVKVASANGNKLGQA